MRLTSKIGGALMLAAALLLYPDFVAAEENSKDKDNTFIDRDGDGIHDGMEHRFRRGGKAKKKRQRSRRDSRFRNQEHRHYHHKNNNH